MEYYIDSGDVGQIKALKEWLPLDGVTINPSLVAEEGKELFSLIDALLPLVDKYLHVQVLARDKRGMIEEAHRLAVISEKIVVKIPVSQQGLAAIKKLDTSEIKVTATGLFGVTQALTAAKAGASYLAPYVSRVDRMEQSGITPVREMLETLDFHNYRSKIIVASIKNANQVKELIRLGVEAMTLSPEIMIQAHSHHLTERAIDMFEEDWLEVFESLELDADLK